MSEPLVEVAVAAITYKRPQGLAKMLHYLARQAGHGTHLRMTIVIVDNDAAQSALPAVSRARAELGLDIVYLVEDVQGIPSARNKAISNIPADADFFCFIDDDEWPAHDWLQSLLSTQAATGAECVHGPVEPVFPEDAPRSAKLSGIFDRRRHGDRSPIDFGATNNILIAAKFLRETGIRFDERMRFTGGSDYFFFRQAQALGLRIVWGDRAVVYEDIPQSRLAWRWILMRHYRIGNTYAVSDILEGGAGRMARRLVIGFCRIGFGVVMLPLAIIDMKFWTKALRHAARGTGMIAGILGLRREEYRPAALLRDRSIVEST